MSNRFHGCLVQVNDTGVLIGGASGVGKSETTLELIERGHSFVSDDQVCLSLDNGRLKGEAPEAIRGLIEIRGLGILSIPDLYGERCCLAGSVIDLAIHIEPGDDPREFERVGFSRKEKDFFGIFIPTIVFSGKTVASLATLIEVAVRDHVNRLRGTVPIRKSSRRFGPKALVQ